MDRGDPRRAARAKFASCGRRRAMARAARRTRRIAADDFVGVLQPDHRTGADLLPRLAFRPRPRRSRRAGRHPDRLRHPRGGRARCDPQTGRNRMNANDDPDFAPIATRIRDNVGRQGFMSHVGAELSELTRGTCTLAVDRRPELLQQHGLFHGGVTAFLVDNATTIAAATSRGQPALTAEYKLNLLSPATGERLICRARVIKPGRQVAVVAADVFSVADGVEKHTATALASIAMLQERIPVNETSPA